MYLRARQYDPDTGRFISLDPVLGSLSVPQTLNRYSYVVNNPLKYTDPTGEIAPLIALAIILLVAGTAGGGVGVASHYVPGIRPVTDPIADVVSFVPLYGDAFALGYYGAQGGLDCVAGSCDPLMVGINLGGSIPIVGDLGKALKYGGKGIGFLGLVARGGGRSGDLASFLRRVDQLKGIPFSPKHLDNAIAMGSRSVDDLSVAAREFLKAAAVSPQGTRFFSKGGDLVAVGHGKKLIVHFGDEQLGTFHKLSGRYLQREIRRFESRGTYIEMSINEALRVFG
jgi:hypothetical protein